MSFWENAQSKIKESVEKSNEIQAHKKECSKDLSTYLTITFGSKELSIPQQSTMRQKSNGNVYFNFNSDVEYRFIGYEWNGPIFENVVTSTSQSNTNTKKDGKVGRMTTGAIVGTILMPGVGTAVGAAIGASGKSKSNSQNNTNMQQTTKSVEKTGKAIIRLKRLSDYSIHSLTINCNTTIDSKIRCFNIDSAPTVSEVSNDINNSLEGIKSLKQLLDMGAISQEEYDAKKNQLLNL